jgi:2-deoxystreptamine N-acetyl-D-glucosaminyltransferase/2-deoxystreptamine glucosyltransferase
MQNYDKGTDFLPQVARELSDRGVEFRMKLVGDGPDRKRLETLGCQLGVADRMEFCGHHDDIPKLMASMDILVVPSRTEAFGLVAIEALAAGTRVVAFKLGGLNEVLANCSEARLVPPWDVPAMSEAILDLWYQHGKSHSVEGRRYVAARFDARRMVREMEQVYLEIVGLGKL